VPKGVIFDIDGTLVDSVDAHARSWQQAFARFGHEIDVHEIRAQIGKGGDQLMPVFLSPEELDCEGHDLEALRSEIFKNDYLPHVQAFPGVRPLFQRIVDRGSVIALASSAKGEELETYKRLTGIGDLIAAATSSEDAERSKPYPDIFAAALDRLKLAAEDVIVVGDSPYDAQAATTLGLRCIGVLCGGFSTHALRDAGCIQLYEDPADLLADFDHSLLAQP
jgi:beta-phosphoglucomutase-like phosphatase (HAD superfamily)